MQALACMLREDQMPDGENEAGVFGDRNELGGRDQSPLRLLPAYQGLHSRRINADADAAIDMQIQACD
jgi:hypothetical protein